MVTDRVRIESLAAGRGHLAQPSGEPGAVLVVPVSRAVPSWLADLVEAARATGAAVLVEAVAPTGLAGEALAGWEIGVATTAFAAGAEVTGIDARRVARVQEVDRSIEAARSAPAPEAAP